MTFSRLVWFSMVAALASPIACASGNNAPGMGNSNGESPSVNNSTPGADAGSSSPEEASLPSVCTTCGSDDASSSTPTPPAPSPDDASQPTGPTPTPADDAGEDAGSEQDSSLGSLFPGLPTDDASSPILFSDAGLGSSSSDDSSSCSTKICIDPVFDCPLQGCFNGCTNFHCN